ncbi:class I SAM-dependent methyltransferase [Nocardioides alcanivorans]|uniref:class I SAM-dependent methyltransferase n=1 Tax=Nocardioides alcanivorans TaxID=2897352 RepID=UPI001F2EB4C4|nr:class I SAM-dependent methyltransferase [Nocardioides alcanivorans]
MAVPHRSVGAALSGVAIDDNGITATARDELVLDLLVDGRRVWSFWLHRDGERRGAASFVEWPPALRRFLNGTATLALVEHATGEMHHEAEVRLGSGAGRIQVVTEDGKPAGLDKSNRLAQTFDTRSAEHVAPLLDSIEEVLEALRTAGIEAFPAYGTLLGAVRGGKLIGHDSDADIGYVSRHSHPVDVVRESYKVQRRLAEMGYAITRYSGAAFKVDVAEGDGSVRGLDVFGGFLTEDSHLVLMGEIRTPFKREWIFPLGTTTLEGRTLPAPADTDRFLSATYGPHWRTPDPAFHFETPETTHRRLNGWFRGTRAGRDGWDRVWSRAAREGAELTDVSDVVAWIDAAGPAPAHVVDLGCGRGEVVDAFARRGVPGVGLDYSPRGFARLAAEAAAGGLPASYRAFNLLELRQVLSTGADLARLPGPRVVLARNLADVTTPTGRDHLWRLAQMLLRDGGRLHLEFQVNATEGPSAKVRLQRPLRAQRIRKDLAARGGRVVAESQMDVAAPTAPQDPAEAGTYRIARWVVEWQ